MLEVSEEVARLIWSLFKSTGSVTPKAYKGRPSRLTEEMIAGIHAKLSDAPDATLMEIIDDLGLPIKKSRLSVWLHNNGYVLKKTLHQNNVQSKTVS